jgi:hypothetical protein
MTYFIFLKYLDSLEDFRKNPHVKIPPKSPCANFQSLGIFKNLIFIRKGFFLKFRPIRPSPAHASLLRPAGRWIPTQPIWPNSFGVFAERRISFDFALCDRDAFSFSRHCHVGPACQLHPLPHVGRPVVASPRRLRPPCAARPPTSRCQVRSSLPAMIPPFNPLP